MANKSEKRVQVSAFLQDRPGSHSFIESQTRPMLNINIYNPSDEPLTITIPAKEGLYLPGLFANQKYANVEFKVLKTHVAVKLPIGSGMPVFNSGKAEPNNFVEASE